MNRQSKPTLGQQAYQLQCVGEMQIHDLAQLLGLFRASAINIRHCQLLPLFQQEAVSVSKRLEIDFELPLEDEHAFLTQLDTFLAKQLPNFRVRQENKAKALAEHSL